MRLHPFSRAGGWNHWVHRGLPSKAFFVSLTGLRVFRLTFNQSESLLLRLKHIRMQYIHFSFFSGSC